MPLRILAFLTSALLVSIPVPALSGPLRVVVTTPDLGSLVTTVGGPEVDVTTLVKGDDRSLSVAAASIVAKVARDRLMRAWHRHWPAYGFDRHVGYPTAEHLKALREHGPCPLHRHSFAPVREAAARA